LLLLFLIKISGVVGQKNYYADSVFILNSAVTSNVIYEAKKYIKLQPGFTFTPTSNNSLELKVNDSDTTLTGDVELAFVGISCVSDTVILNLQNNYGTFLHWQISTDNLSFSDITGGNTNPYKIFANSTTYYRASSIFENFTFYSKAVEYSPLRKYYVNDASLNNDKFTTAIGDNNNDGLSPSTPKASLNSIVSSYALKECDTVFVDAGSYSATAAIFTGADMGSRCGNLVILGADTSSTVLNASEGNSNIILYGSSHITIKNISFSVSNDNTAIDLAGNIAILGSGNNTIVGCKLLTDGFTNLSIFGSSKNVKSKSDSNLILNNTIKNSHSLGRAVLIGGSCKNTRIKGDTIKTSGGRETYGICVSGINESTAAQNIISWPSDITIDSNKIKSNDYGIAIDGLEHVIDTINISGNIINITSSDKTDGACIWMRKTGVDSTSTNKIVGNHLIGAKQNIYLGQDCKYDSIYTNFLSGSENGITVSSGTSTNNKIYFNSFYNSGTDIDFADGAVSGCKLVNNIFYTTSANTTNACLKAAGNTQFREISNNLYYNPNGARVAQLGGTYYASLSTWQQVDHLVGVGNGDANSLTGDPKYFSIQSNNLIISTSSPAYLAGLELTNITVDITGETLSRPPSIGGSVGVLSVEDAPYATLKKNLDGSFYTVYNGALKLKFDEEYIPTELASLSYKLFDNKHKEMVLDPAFNNDHIKLGDNRIILSIVNCSSMLPIGYYVLEVTNEKNEKWFLRFKNNTSSYYLTPCN